jgi:chromosome segregation ATPase|uniref:Putative chromosome segregation protein SMC n=1 Tax=uncultured marine group II/III euryarchaeote AD1000_113_C07 TaxID=1457718 RepID=A0A075FII7_9EURY|nr:putative chromosome segregation protein SMC [uncultured marine group II/III euryarchaeote AD1000_113_C07]|tara:strand:+ start:63 stop:683 length:621 start_codon:yes stop_codon:yes gene_type:complete
MSEEDSTVSPDLRIRQLEEDLLKEKDRLEKLYAGYTALKDATDEKDATIDVLERQMIDKEIEMEGMQELFSEKDVRIRDLELDGAKNSQRVKHLEPELQKMEEMYTRESARLGRVFEVAEDLDEALRVAKGQLNARDDWYAQHMKLFEDLSTAIQTRYDMIDSAIEAIREQELKQATFRERMDEALEAAGDELTAGDEPEEEVDDE